MTDQHSSAPRSSSNTALPQSPDAWNAWFDAMRTSTPVWYDEQHQRWNVFRYDHVQRVLTDYTTFSSQLNEPSSPEQRSADLPNLIFSDPPIHRGLRALIMQAFTAQAVMQLQARITALATSLLDRCIVAKSMDVVVDLARVLPTTVIAELLGIPARDHARFQRWADASVSLVEANIGELASGAAGNRPEFTDMSMYLIKLIEQRRRAPQHDLISSLLAARIDGRSLTRFEIMSFCSLLLVAGTETTANLIANTVWCCIEQPNLWRRLRAEPSLVPGTIEEVLRYRSPLRGIFRRTTCAVEINGQIIPPQSQIFAWIAAANRDPAQFADQDRFDILRTPNRHVSFGHGIHFCLGALLSRLEARVMLELMLQRFADVRLVGGPPPLVAHLAMNGPQMLPVHWTLAG